MFDPTTGRYGFQEGSDYGTEDEFMTDLMNEPEYRGVGEGERGDNAAEGVEGTRGEGASDAHDVDDSFEELSDSELEPVISHSIDLDQVSGDEEEKDTFSQGGSLFDKGDCKYNLISHR